MLQALQEWPNTMTVGVKPVRVHAAAAGSQGPLQACPQQPSRLGRAFAAVRQRAGASAPQSGDHVQGVWARNKPLTRPDQHLLDGCGCMLQQSIGKSALQGQKGIHEACHNLPYLSMSIMQLAEDGSCCYVGPVFCHARFLGDLCCRIHGHCCFDMTTGSARTPFMLAYMTSAATKDAV